MYNIEPWNLVDCPFHLHSPDDYEARCTACEVKRVVRKQQLLALLPHLVFDKKRTGLQGRGLLSDYAPLHLIAGDRLEPSAAVPDVGNWRRAANSHWS